MSYRQYTEMRPTYSKGYSASSYSPSRYETPGEFIESVNPLNTANYSSNTRSLYIWLIVITIITFFVALALNIFFVYLPLARMEVKFDDTVKKLDEVADGVKTAAQGADRIIKDVEELGKVALSEFDKVKAGVCTFLRAEGLPTFGFCSEPGVVALLPSQTTQTIGSTRRRRQNECSI